MDKVYSNTTKRFLYFFKVKTDSGSSFEEIIKLVYALPASDMYSLKIKKEEEVFLKSARKENGFWLGEICSFRTSGIPTKAKRGSRSVEDIKILENEGLVETSHFLFSPKNSILVLEYNHFGPRIGTLQWHLNSKIANQDGYSIAEVTFESILNRETLELLEKYKEVRAISFTVPKSKMNISSKKDSSIFDAYVSALDFGEAGAVSVTLKNEKKERKSIMSIDQIRSELRGYQSLEENFDELKVRAIHKSTGLTKTFDLLRDKIKDEVQVIKLSKGRAIDTEDIFEKMQLSYKDNKRELLRLSTWRNE